MISSFEVGAVFKILDEASPALRKILTQVRELNKVIEQARVNIQGLVKSLDMNLAPAVQETRALAAEWKAVSYAAQGARRSMTSAARVAATVPSLPAPRFIPAVGAGGGRAGGGGRHRPGWLGGGAHVSGPGMGIPGGGHVRLGGAAMAGAGLLGYGAYQAAETQDAVWQMIYHTGQDQKDPGARQKMQDAIQGAMVASGYNIHDVSEAALQAVRMFQGTPGKGIDVMPTLLEIASKEARAKGSSLEESMKSFIGLAHMTQAYTPEQILKLAPAFAYMSVANPTSLSSIERAAGYAVPLLKSGLEVDPMDSLLLGTVLTRAGATSTKSGTWLREMALRAMPGTSMMSKMAFRKHEEALKAFGLVDDNDKPTWFTGGKPDIMKMLEIAGGRAGSIPIEKRAAYERALFGAQGGGGFALLADPAVRQQIAELRKERDSPEFRNRYNSFLPDYAAGSTVQQARTTMQEFNVTMADLGMRVLPAVNGALKDFKAVLEGLRSLIPGGDKDGKSGDKWKVGTRAIEGAVIGAGAGALLGFGGGAIPGAALGGLGGGLYGVIEGIAKSSTAAAPPVDRFGREVINTGNAASSAQGAVKGLADAIRGLGGAAPGGVFPGGTSTGGAQKMNFLKGPGGGGAGKQRQAAVYLGREKVGRIVLASITHQASGPLQGSAHKDWSRPYGGNDLVYG